MGEAKRRAVRLEQWRKGLTTEESVVADVALRVFHGIIERFQATGMCYRMSFFLTELLKQEWSIEVQPIVGYVNDGTTDLMASHAWIETLGKITDLNLAYTDHPSVQLPGNLLILGTAVRQRARYSYHREQDEQAVAALNRLESAMVTRKQEEHKAMTEVSASSKSRRSFLDSAPDGLTYAVLADMLKV